MRGIFVPIAGTIFFSLCQAASGAEEIVDDIYRCLNIPPWQEVQRGVVHVCTGDSARQLYDKMVRYYRYDEYPASIINDLDQTRRPFGRLTGVNTDTRRTYCYRQRFYFKDDREPTESYSCFYRLERDRVSRPDDEDRNMPAAYAPLQR